MEPWGSRQQLLLRLQQQPRLRDQSCTAKVRAGLGRGVTLEEMRTFAISGFSIKAILPPKNNSLLQKKLAGAASRLQ